MQIGILGKKVLLRLRSDLSSPEQRLVSHLKEEHEGAVLRARFGAVRPRMQNLHAHPGPKIETLALLPFLAASIYERGDFRHRFLQGRARVEQRDDEMPGMKIADDDFRSAVIGTANLGE